ncbi:hypothetical protein Hypma_012115 [Hypsizygus marmoreus]|uniref:CFEM domain-containing protein n=1 Tax=Hypsizygus marmoreus TaxID=39966 RepID=A0A369JET6_HYPMA|nr:hypothetical protein Hypma_012115 [Hypsizygus marmoreus]
MFSKSFFTLALLVVSAAAQSTTSTSETEIPSGVSGITPCIIGCVQPAAEANGCAFTDPTCVCASAQFQADARACLESTCSAAEVQAALGLQAQQCGAIGISATGTATTPTGGESGTVSSPTGSATTQGTSTGTGSSTVTTPTSTSLTTTGTTSSPTTTGTSPPAQTSNAAVQEGGVGMLGAVVFGLLGLVL